MSYRHSRDASRLASARIAADAATRDPNAADPNQAFETLFPEPNLGTLWSSTLATTYPTALTVLNSDRAKQAPCTIRWQFTGSFSLKREEGIARGSFVVQVKRFLQFKNASVETILVNFPRFVGRGRLVDINVHHTALAALAEAPLVYRGARLERHLVGPALPRTALVVAIVGHSEEFLGQDIAREAALFLQPFAKVHDVWLECSATNVEPEPRPTNRILVLVDTTPTPNGGRDINRIRAIPGYAMLGGRECALEYEGRLEWCTTCRSRSTSFHNFDNCPRRRCFNCGRQGHNTDHCQEQPANSAMVSRP